FMCRISLPLSSTLFPYTTLFRSLRAGFHRRLEQLEEGDAAGVLRLATTNRAAQGADAAGVDANAGAQRNVFDDGRGGGVDRIQADRKSTRLNSSHVKISYAVFCL